MQQHKRTWKYAVRPIVLSGGVGLVSLSDGSTAVVDEADVPTVCGWNWSAARTRCGLVYAHRGSGAGRMSLQNAVLGLPREVLVDHKDGDSLNNRRGNLREASREQNCWNRRISSTNRSGFKGVSFRKDRSTWLAAIRHRGVLRKIGTYPTAEAAAAAYDIEALRLFGDFAALNFPGEFGRAA